MRNRLKITVVVRRIHLFASSIIAFFCLTYAISGFVLVNNQWFSKGELTHLEPMEYEFATRVDTSNMELLGAQIKSDFKLRGRMSYRKDWQGTRTYTYFMPASTTTVQLNESGDRVKISQKRSMSIVRIAKAMHTLRKFNGGIAYFIWGVFFDIAAISFVVFPITGIIIWFKGRKAYPAGWGMLISGFAITALTVLFLWL